MRIALVWNRTVVLRPMLAEYLQMEVRSRPPAVLSGFQAVPSIHVISQQLTLRNSDQLGRTNHAV